ncbi:MAG: choice-of-anchor D domain-containing protein [Myxococcales bacterium]|jgi:hypothetical protein
MRRLPYLPLIASLAIVSSACPFEPTEETADTGTAPPVDAGASVGDPFFVSHSASGSELVRELEVDFGSVLVGQSASRRVAIYNAGAGSFQVVSLMLGGNTDSAFGHAFAPFVLAPGENREIELFFSPLAPGDRLAAASLGIRDGSVESLTLQLRGTGLQKGCAALASSLDFRSVAVGTGFVKSLDVANPSALPLEVGIALPSGADASAFNLVNFPPGSRSIAPGATLSIEIEFRPSRLGAHSATLAISGEGHCQTAIVELSGNGVEHALVVSPFALDYGFVPIGASSTLKLRLENLGNRELHAGPFTLETLAGGEFELAASGQLSIAPGGQAEVAVVFTPDEPGLSSARLVFESDDPTLPSKEVALMGRGGGPELDARPRSLDFDVVAVGGSRTEMITLSNVGRDEPGTDDDNLRFAVRAADGTWTETPAELLGDATGFTIEWPPIGYLSRGLPAGSEVALPIVFSPSAPGRYNATLRIYSNDFLKPAIDIALSAEATTFPHCEYEVVPAQLDFGNLLPGATRTLSFAVRNTSISAADVCVISPPRLAYGTPAELALVDPPTSNVNLEPGESLEIAVRFSPGQHAGFAGAVEVFTSSASRPKATIPLIGSSQPTCLALVPDRHDFGDVAVGCDSDGANFIALNLCPTPVELTSLDLLPSGSNAFRVSHMPSLPATLAANESTMFRVVFSPSVLGRATSTVRLETSGGEAIVVPLWGNGATNSTRTDVFHLDAVPKVDVLLVVDDSCSMYDKQVALGAAFSSFIAYADSHGVDYRIAVTTTSVDPSQDFANGRFVPLQGGTRVITPTTPNKQQVFAQNVNVGTNGHWEELLFKPVELALSEPLLSTHNAGFLRPDALLSIVLVSDAADQDQTPLSRYAGFLDRLKGPNQYTVSGMLPTQASLPGGSCQYDDLTAGQSHRARTLVAATGGALEEICSTDWPAAMSNIGAVAFGSASRSRFHLSELPDTAEPILVEVDGAPLPAGARWAYNASANAIDFEPSAAPEPGSTVRVTYTAICQ